MRLGPWLASLALVLLAPSAARSEEPACRVTAALEPERAVVGQPVVWRVTIHSRIDVTELEWIAPPAFPHIRTEALQGRTADAAAGADAPSDAQSDARADAYRRREERRALFAEQPGTFAIESPGLRCKPRDAAPAAVRVPTTRLTVDPLPAGAPAGFTGVVGPLVARAHVSPRTIALGETVSLAVSLRGRGNLWDVANPIEGIEIADAETFPHPSTLEITPGTQLSVQRVFRTDLVPRSEGTLTIPEIAIPYFDPKARTYRYAITEAARVDVTPRESAGVPTESGADALEPTTMALEPPAKATATRLTLGPTLSLIAALGVTVALCLYTLRRRQAGSAARKALETAGDARHIGDRAEEAAVLARALRGALARHIDDVNARSPEQLLARGGHPARVEEALRILEAVEGARFDPGATLPDRDSIQRALARIG